MCKSCAKLKLDKIGANYLVIEVLVLQCFVAILLAAVFRWFTVERRHCQCVLVQNTVGLQEHDDFVVLFVRARDLLPADELVDLLGQLPELLEIDMAVR